APVLSPPHRPPPGPTITYKVVRTRRADDHIQLPRPAEIVTPAEREALDGEEAEPSEPALSMGDWRRGRRAATNRRTPPGG
ncbi:MAG: hypothetical protein RMJ35_11600, partial [Phycisphaerales bacterium]|nr:hypothetical protein [Phycisphaerales bacterium]